MKNIKELIKVSKTIKNSKTLNNYIEVTDSSILITNMYEIIELNNIYDIEAGFYNKTFFDKGIFETINQPKEVVIVNSNIDFVGKLTNDNIKDMLISTHFCSNDDFRPAMKGVYITRNTIAATNAHILRYVHKDLDINSESILPISIVKLLNVIGGEFNMYINNDDVKFTNSDGVCIYGKLINATFPNYRQIIPSESIFKIDIKNNELLDAISVLKNYWNKSTCMVEFHFKDNGVVLLKSSNIELNLHKEIEVKMLSGKLPEFKIGFSGKLLLTCLKSFDKNSFVSFQLNSSHKPAIINSEVLVMPIYIND